MNSKMVNQAMYAVMAASYMAATYADQMGPNDSDEIHSIAFDPVKGGAIRNEQFGMRANEKAGLTIGFTVFGFFFFLLAAFVGTIYSRVSALEKKVEDLKLAAEAADAAAKL
eukprot:CAMPEP_0118928630 /NCGR_PEP_ID=MMETSP1169-20130426/5845_1 /TAXON_ID=36882 /ORGANISM="Pyramimonas obovata, Strain CCMP722" /LENGTH=111 /DNA_ID=CAMNT_0006870659 /DNA_START=64 /DNA_END=399 /DNA_ORIENTATION=+